MCTSRPSASFYRVEVTLPRRPRAFVEGGIYHVFNRTVRGDPIFLDPDECRRFLGLLHKVKVRDDLTIFAWCVMSNHYHLAIRTGPVHLSRSIGFVQFRFGQDFNRRHGSAGPRWQSRFKAKFVDSSNYLDQLIAYIHLNPVEAQCVDDPADFFRSGHREILGATTKPVVDVEQTLTLYGSSALAARRHYLRVMEGSRGVNWASNLPGQLPWWQHEADRPLVPPSPTAWIDERGISTGRERPSIDAEAFLARAAEHLNVPLLQIAGRQRDAQSSRTRFLIVGLGIERWRLKPSELAVCLGRRPETVGRWALRAGKLRIGDSEFRAAYEELDQSLSSSQST